ncbi:hypothetical protein AB6A40_011749, partial [Gnathostoma spinigerum]
TNAAKLLHNSSQFHHILQLLLTCGNLISGDFNAQMVKGFRTSSIMEMAEFKFPPPSETSLIDVVARAINKHFIDLAKFVENTTIVVKAGRGKF